MNLKIIIMNNLEIHVATEFNKALGARYIYEGQFSGQQFLETLLSPRFEEAKEKKVKLVIYLDGVLGYPSSFVSGSFGKLSMSHGAESVLATIEFVSSNSLRIEKIVREITKPIKK